MNANQNDETLLRPMPPGMLFDGDDALFKRIAKTAKGYVEYGCGTSTIWMAENSSAKIQSVDTSHAWAQSTQKLLSRKQDCAITHIDLGPIGAWGRPMGYTHHEKFNDYFFYNWDQAPDAQMVLIDGRFRVACFCASVIRSNPGTHILFDDYANRAYYQVVETIMRPTELCGRQALFIMSDGVDKTRARELLNKFEYVMD